MNYPVLGVGVFLMLLAGVLFGMPGGPPGWQFTLALVGLVLAVYAVFLSGRSQKLTGGKRIKDNWV
jgi:hypothetical protein